VQAAKTRAVQNQPYDEAADLSDDRFGCGAALSAISRVARHLFSAEGDSPPKKKPGKKGEL
jgi:hypothetical protein